MILLTHRSKLVPWNMSTHLRCLCDSPCLVPGIRPVQTWKSDFVVIWHINVVFCIKRHMCVYDLKGHINVVNWVKWHKHIAFGIDRHTCVFVDLKGHINVVSAWKQHMHWWDPARQRARLRSHAHLTPPLQQCEFTNPIMLTPRRAHISQSMHSLLHWHAHQHMYDVTIYICISDA